MISRLRGAPLSAAALLAAVGLVHGGCADTSGTTGYDDPITTIKTGVVIDARTLIQWADEGKLNAPFGTADRVVVADVTTAANFTSKRHIPDAVLLDSSTLTMVREEGLGPAGSMMLAGSQMDALVQKLGIDGSTTVVFTIPKGSSDGDAYQLSVAYWTFRYWGFSRERLKILNGGDDAWEVAGQTLTDTVAAVVPSSFSVTAN
jgi:3-mercaptopyruvate sulfurtransferase SseA